MCRYFKRVVNSDYILEWKSKELSDESIKSPSASHNFLNASLNYLVAKITVRFSGSFLKQDKITYTHGTVVNIYIVYETNKNDNTGSDPKLENCLPGVVILTKTLILISINILDMELNLIDIDFFLILVVELEKMKEKIKEKMISYILS